ncbi:hypothetical protein [Mobilisporobacter senegalensis]|nr:hypothetical protein [Mobilisporobacter senegalensis]
MNEMYKYVTPKRIGSQPLGVWQLSHYTKGVVNFAKSREISVDLYFVNKEMKVSSWGGYAYIDVDDYVDGENLYKAIVFFTKK